MKQFGISGECLDQRMDEEDERRRERRASRLFQPRYKRYAPWPVVLWCRLRGHPIQAWWHSGDVQRCINCGDRKYERSER
jgi:hypothetical protein